MYARVVTFEGGDASKIDQGIAEIREQSKSGPPPGVPGKEMIMLLDRERGKHLFIAFFETEEDYRQGDETLNAMSPPTEGGMGRRTSVEKYEVPIHVKA
jgi:hypothetical protein